MSKKRTLETLGTALLLVIALLLMFGPVAYVFSRHGTPSVEADQRRQDAYIQAKITASINAKCGGENSSHKPIAREPGWYQCYDKRGKSTIKVKGTS